MVESQILTYSTRFDPVHIKKIEVEPNADQILVETSYISLNPVDVKIRSLALFPSQHRMGRDFAGIVAKVGANLEGKFTVGERVSVKLNDFSTGYAGTFSVVDPNKDAVIKTPANLNDAEAAAFPLVFGTAWQILSYRPLKPELPLLILGGSTSVGAFAVQIAKLHYGIRHVVVTSSSEEYAKSFGADEVLNYRSPTFRDDLVATAERIGKFQAIIDTAGGYDALAVSDKILRPACEGSFYVTILGDATVTSDYSKTVFSLITSLPRMIFRLLLGRRLFDIDYSIQIVAIGPWVKEAPKFLANPKVKVPIDSEYSLTDFKSALERSIGASAHGKIVIKMT